MITSAQARSRYGPPDSTAMQKKWLVLYNIPEHLKQGHIPSRVYCNHDLVLPLTNALTAIVECGLVSTIDLWDGCYCLRKMRRSTAWSLHADGLAIDINAYRNKQGRVSTQDPRLVDCFEKHGWDWGGRWSGSAIDPMHFQLRTFPSV